MKDGPHPTSETQEIINLQALVEKTVLLSRLFV